MGQLRDLVIDELSESLFGTWDDTHGHFIE